MADVNGALARFRAAAEGVRGVLGWEPERHVAPLNRTELPWDYEGLARRAMSRASSALDLGTGGGEVLSRLAPFPPTTLATEPWLPNLPVAAGRLQPLGADVVFAHSCHIPVRSKSLDLVLNRHEEFAPDEIARVLRPGGVFITQQVDEENWRELVPHFPRMQRFAGLYQHLRNGLEVAGLVIGDGGRHLYEAVYSGVEDVVRMLVLAPWKVPDFGVEQDIDALVALERELATPDGIRLTEGRFLIVARKP
jgi:SAM-dependent methyltransferase